MKEMSDGELIISFRNGEKKSFEILVNRHLKSVYFYCLKMIGTDDANDLAQETFIKIWKSINKYNPKKSFKVWMYRIARNSCLDHLRKKQPTVFSDLRKEDEEILPEDQIADDRPSADAELLAAEKSRELGELLTKLPVPVQEVFVLYYHEEMNFQEIADTLKSSINTVKSRHRRGLTELRRLIQG